MKTTATAVVWRRVLLACLLCALWGEGTVRATDVATRMGNFEKVIENAGLAGKALNFALEHLATIDERVDKLHIRIVGGSGTSAQAKSDAKTLMDAAESALTAAKEAEGYAGEAEKSLIAEESPRAQVLKTSLKTAVEEARGLSVKLETLNNAAQKLNTAAQSLKDDNITALESEVDGLIRLYEDVAPVANAATKTHLAIQNDAGELRTIFEKNPELLETLPAKTQPGKAGKEDVKEETQHPNKPQDSDKPQDPATQISTGPENDKSFPDGSSEKNSTSFSTHEGVTPDGAHGGAIATCTAAPLLLLLTAVAYAAVC